jgi:hypothetical protein
MINLNTNQCILFFPLSPHSKKISNVSNECIAVGFSFLFFEISDASSLFKLCNETVENALYAHAVHFFFFSFFFFF